MITREMTISDIIARYPQTIEVFRSFGLSCMECQIADYEEVGVNTEFGKNRTLSLLLEL